MTVYSDFGEVLRVDTTELPNEVSPYWNPYTFHMYSLIVHRYINNFGQAVPQGMHTKVM